MIRHLHDDVIWLQLPECSGASYCVQYFFFCEESLVRDTNLNNKDCSEMHSGSRSHMTPSRKYPISKQRPTWPTQSPPAGKPGLLSWSREHLEHGRQSSAAPLESDAGEALVPRSPAERVCGGLRRVPRVCFVTPLSVCCSENSVARHGWTWPGTDDWKTNKQTNKRYCEALLLGCSLRSKVMLRSIYMVRFCRMQPPYDSLKADLHGTILSHATSLRHAYDTKKSRRILKHALKPYDNRGLKCVVSVT